MIGANEDLDNIPKQFISVEELLELFAECEKTTLEKSAQWLLNNIQILNKTKKLVLENTYTLAEYERSDNDYYNCPIEAIRLVANGEECSVFNDCVGFARHRILSDLKDKGLAINDDLIKNSQAYISQICYEDDDNFYKNQCVDLRKELDELKNNSNQKPEKLSDIHKYAVFLDRGNSLYCASMELIGRLNYEFNALGGYTGRSNKEDKVKDFLRDHGEEYGYKNPKPFHYKALASLIHIMKDQKPTKEILNELQVEEQYKNY